MPVLKTNILTLSQTKNLESTSHLLSPQCSNRYWNRNRSTPFEVEYILCVQQTFPSQFQQQHFYLSLKKQRLECSSLFFLTLKNKVTELISINFLQPSLSKYWKNTLWGEVLFSFFASCLQGIILYFLCSGNG